MVTTYTTADPRLLLRFAWLQGIEGRLYFNQGELQGFTPARGQAVEGNVGNNSRAQPIARQISPGTQVRQHTGPVM